MNFILTRLLPYAWPIAAAAGLALLGTVGVQAYQIRGLKLEAKSAEAAANRTALNRFRTQQESLGKIQDEKDSAVRDINAALDALLDSMRERSNRLPEPARAACAGTTGRELSGADATFLVRFAGEADRQRAALDACQKREQALR